MSIIYFLLFIGYFTYLSNYLFTYLFIIFIYYNWYLSLTMPILLVSAKTLFCNTMNKLIMIGVWYFWFVFSFIYLFVMLSHDKLT